MIIKKNMDVTILDSSGLPRYRKIVEIRTTPNGYELICKSAGRKKSERRWGKIKHE